MCVGEHDGNNHIFGFVFLLRVLFISAPDALSGLTDLLNKGKQSGCDSYITHGSSHGSFPTRTTLPRFTPPRYPAPVLSGEYHYHQLTVYLTRPFRSVARGEGALVPITGSPGARQVGYRTRCSDMTGAIANGVFQRALGEWNYSSSHPMQFMGRFVGVFLCACQELFYFLFC